MANSATAKGVNGKRAPSEPSVDDLTDQIAVLKEDIASLTATMSDFGKSKASAATQTVKETAKDIKETGQLKAMETQERAEDFIRTQPATALGIAAAAGFLVGLMTVRR